MVEHGSFELDPNDTCYYIERSVVGSWEVEPIVIIEYYSVVVEPSFWLRPSFYVIAFIWISKLGE